MIEINLLNILEIEVNDHVEQVVHFIDIIISFLNNYLY
jgi:hypothetical protein